MKMRPTDMDIFIPNDDGKLGGIGIMEFMKSIQQSYYLLHNQYMLATINSNDPFGFFNPTGNMRDEKIKVKHGYLYPSPDPQSINITKLPAPDPSLLKILEMVRNFAQL